MFLYNGAFIKQPNFVRWEGTMVKMLRWLNEIHIMATGVYFVKMRFTKNKYNWIHISLVLFDIIVYFQYIVYVTASFREEFFQEGSSRS